MKSPLKSNPLRNPGDSVQEELSDLFVDKVLYHLVVAGFLIMLALVEWSRWYFQKPPSPLFYTIIAIAYIAYAAIKIRKSIKTAKNLKLGRDGERAVGQYLEELRESGAKVFHDIPGQNFNLDHVVIHSSGIYVIETKTHSKPDKGRATIVFDGETVTYWGRQPDRNPITQVKAAASWLSELLNESCGRKTNIRPVVVYPGWYIEPTAEAKSSDVWVLNPKALPAFIGHSRTTLTPEEMKLFAFHLSRYVRTSP